MDKKLFIFLIFGLIYFITVNARRECVVQKVPNSDTVCVCNATYCDDFPALQKPKAGFANVYESTKTGDRFKESELQFSKQSSNANSTKSVVISIDSKTTFQTINGFGGAFTDSTGQMLKSVNQSLADLLLDSYFSSDGIEYSVARVPLAGTDFSDRPYSYDDVSEDLELKHFALQKEDLEWKIPFIQRALKVSPHKLKLFGSPWAPPAWMKTNNKVSNSGELKGKIGGEYYQAFANYFVKFLDEYKSHGINFWGLTVENEPTEGWDHNYGFNCLNFTGVTEREFVKQNLGPTLAKAGYGADKLKLMVFDDNLNGHFNDFVPLILNDKDAAKYVAGIAYHWYGNQGMGGFPDGFLTEINKNFSQFFTLNTEACHLEGAVLGSWSAAEKYAYDIIRALNNFVTGWVEWNMALDMEAGPRWNDKKRGFGGTLNIDPTKGEAYKQPSFYAIGHFSKFVSPDSKRIGHTVDKPIAGLSVVTVKRPDGQTVLVALNANKEEVVININDSNNHLSHKIPANSLQTYIW